MNTLQASINATDAVLWTSVRFYQKDSPGLAKVDFPLVRANTETFLKIKFQVGLEDKLITELLKKTFSIQITKPNQFHPEIDEDESLKEAFLENIEKIVLQKGDQKRYKIILKAIFGPQHVYSLAGETYDLILNKKTIVKQIVVLSEASIGASQASFLCLQIKLLSQNFFWMKEFNPASLPKNLKLIQKPSLENLGILKAEALPEPLNITVFSIKFRQPDIKGIATLDCPWVESAIPVQLTLQLKTSTKSFGLPFLTSLFHEQFKVSVSHYWGNYADLALQANQGEELTLNYLKNLNITFEKNTSKVILKASFSKKHLFSSTGNAFSIMLGSNILVKDIVVFNSFKTLLAQEQRRSAKFMKIFNTIPQVLDGSYRVCFEAYREKIRKRSELALQKALIKNSLPQFDNTPCVWPSNMESIINYSQPSLPKNPCPEDPHALKNIYRQFPNTNCVPIEIEEAPIFFEDGQDPLSFINTQHNECQLKSFDIQSDKAFEYQNPMFQNFLTFDVTDIPFNNVNY